MLHTETVETGTLDLIKRLMQDPLLKEFILVGGTALSLKIGHRKSIDIDLFTAKPFKVPDAVSHLTELYQAEQIRSAGGVVICTIDGVKVDLIVHQYKELQPPELMEGIRICSLLDIAAMKLNAIAGNGTRYKDFVDVYFLLDYMPLQKIVEGYIAKYPNVSTGMALSSLLYHKDITKIGGVDFTGKEVNWERIQERLKEAVKNDKLTFKQSQEKKQNTGLLEKKRQQKKPGSGLSR